MDDTELIAHLERILEALTTRIEAIRQSIEAGGGDRS